MLVVKPSKGNFHREGRGRGFFSYPVPEFTWEHTYLGSFGSFNTQVWADQGFDVVVQDDGSNWGEFYGPLPLVFNVVDSTLSEAYHYVPRIKHAKQFDLVLLDHDRLDRFPNSRRLSHCVNDRVFKPTTGERDIDISFHCASSKVGDGTRRKVRLLLNSYTKEAGLVYASGAKGLQEYATNMGRSKIVVNWPRVPSNRPHRVFDTMAAGACLVTGPLPEVSDEERIAGWHYFQVESWEDVPDVCEELINTGLWKVVAARGYDLAMERYTWAVKAKELRAMMSEVLGI
jgi:hypothetical protein